MKFSLRFLWVVLCLSNNLVDSTKEVMADEACWKEQTTTRLEIHLTSIESGELVTAMYLPYPGKIPR